MKGSRAMIDREAAGVMLWTGFAYVAVGFFAVAIIYFR